MLHEISGAIIAITLVMSAVFVPVTFVSGPVGVFYRQFGVTMAAAIILSGVVALTLTPVLCAMILKPHDHRPAADARGKMLRRPGTLAVYVVVGLPILAGLTYLAYALWGPIGLLLLAAPAMQRPFSRGVDRITSIYAGTLRPIVTRRVVTLVCVAGFAFGIVVVNTQMASGFIPGEDQGIIYAVLQTPPGSTLEYTNAKSRELEKLAKEIEGVVSVTSVAGYEILTEGRGSNAGTAIINLEAWSERNLTAREIIEELESAASEITDVKLEFFEPPAIPGFGAAGGISLRILDQTQSSTADYQRLGEVTDKFMAALGKRKEVEKPFTFYAADYPQYELIIDNDVAMQKGVSIELAMENLNILIGSTYEQGFILFNQFYKVYVQAWPQFRRMPEDLGDFFVKNERGDMVPYSSFMKLRKEQGLNEITRYNLYPSAAIQAVPAAGYSSGEAIDAIRQVAEDTLPRGYGLGWEGLSWDESKKGNESIYIFFVVVAFVYLVLVGQYESFLLPLAVILSLPIGIFGSFFFLRAAGLANDVWAQLGLIMLVGLLGKNAILIVEFAIQRRREGSSLQDAAIDGGRLRFRPIQMTSFAFIAGLLPLVVATGAGALGNRTIGTTGVGGMLLGTIVGVLVIPGLYFLFAQLADGRKLLTIQEDALGVVKLQQQAGRVTRLAVQRFEAEVLKNQSRRYDLEQRRVEAENRVNFLVGRFPQPVSRRSRDFKDSLPNVVHAGVPTQLLDSRPDLRQAEEELAAAELDVEAARAEFYPALSIDTAVGYESFNLKHLVMTPESLAYNAAANLAMPVINRKAIEAEYLTANAEQITAVLNYERTILEAFTEVANLVSMMDNLQKSYDLQKRQVDVLEASIGVSNVLFQSARADYVEVLLTRRDALDAELELIETKRQQFTAMVDLYRALGGGWRHVPAESPERDDAQL